MSIEVSQQHYTVQEFLNLEWPDDDDNEYELIKGEIVAKPALVTARKGAAVAKLAAALSRAAGYDSKEELGIVYIGSSTHLGQPQGDSFFDPDISFVRTGRFTEEGYGPLPVAPDLVVEVWSPTDTTEKIQNKIDTYLSAGVRLIWSIYMVNRFIVVYTLNDPDPKFLNLKNELDGGEVLPGFKLPVSYLFD